MCRLYHGNASHQTTAAPNGQIKEETLEKQIERKLLRKNREIKSLTETSKELILSEEKLRDEVRLLEAALDTKAREINIF